jgi:hypothetical protein
MFVVCIDLNIQKREEKFRWMEMGIVVKIHVPIQHQFESGKKWYGWKEQKHEKSS